MQTSARDHVRTYHLHKLATNLDARGFAASMRVTYPPVLRVFSPRTTLLAESIDCVAHSDEDGRLRWCFRWSWGEVIGDTEDPVAAAEKVATVLAADHARPRPIAGVSLISPT